jgi:hypothetical protein
MTAPELMKRWKVSVTLLERAKAALPAPTLETSKLSEEILGDYHEYLEQNKLERALDCLEHLGKVLPCRGGFWRDLERAATNMNLEARLPELRRHFSKAVATCSDGHS